MTSLQVDDLFLEQHELENESGKAASLPRRQTPTRRRKLPSQPDKIIQLDESEASKETEIQIMELREQLVALKVHNRDQEEELKLMKKKFWKKREAMKAFEDGDVDI